MPPTSAEPGTRPVIVRLESVDSTQAVAFDLALLGATDGTVVVADHQTHGRGRRGRAWADAPGASLLLSIVVRSPLDASRLPLFSYVAAVAVAEALAATWRLPARLKWPNDVVIAGRKIAGILLEARTPAAAGRPLASPGAPAPALTTIIGIGVNVGQRGLPPDLAGRATSAALEIGADADRDALLDPLLRAFARWRARLEGEGFEPVRRRWLELAETIGREVDVDGVRGVAVDLDADGALVLEGPAGRHRVVAGELAA
jgi:BirA family biotin operon repressor/biotin-[acetyl-CoA-carboxylase] ligase